MAYAYDLVWGDDWAHGFDRQSEWEYPTPVAAYRAARDVLARETAAGVVDGPAGIYVWEQWENDDVRGWIWTGACAGTLIGMDSDCPDIDVTGENRRRGEGVL